MIISREYEVTPKISLANKTSDVVKVSKGTITKITIQSAPGVNGEIYVRVIHFENSIVPDESGEWITLTGTRQEYSLQFNNWHEVYSVTIEICAPDTKFTHNINIEIELEEQMTIQQLFSSFIQGGFKWQNR